MREAFIERAFKPASLEVIRQANEIIAAYRAQGFTLTLRQLYYQFVSRDLIKNRQSEYKRLGSIINDGRLAGLIDWAAIEDRTRNLRSHAWWTSPRSIIGAAANGYAENVWRHQPRRIEVWIEKDALVGVIEPVCDRWRLPYFACRGYTSQSEQYAAGKRLASQRGDPLILHLGDHDPSGLDMTRDNADRLAMFARMGIEVKRLALNYDQIEEYDPPPNPTKDTDARSTGYATMMEGLGADPETCWELDALEPNVIDTLIDNAVRDEIDQDAWDRAIEDEEANKARLQRVAERWDDVVEFIDGETPDPDDEAEDDDV